MRVLGGGIWGEWVLGGYILSVISVRRVTHSVTHSVGGILRILRLISPSQRMTRLLTWHFHPITTYGMIYQHDRLIPSKHAAQHNLDLRTWHTDFIMRCSTIYWHDTLIRLRHATWFTNMTPWPTEVMMHDLPTWHHHPIMTCNMIYQHDKLIPSQHETWFTNTTPSSPTTRYTNNVPNLQFYKLTIDLTIVWYI